MSLLRQSVEIILFFSGFFQGFFVISNSISFGSSGAPPCIFNAFTAAAVDHSGAGGRPSGDGWVTFGTAAEASRAVAAKNRFV
jgi:hypothetical protein